MRCSKRQDYAMLSTAGLSAVINSRTLRFSRGGKASKSLDTSSAGRRDQRLAHPGGDAASRKPEGWVRLAERPQPQRGGTVGKMMAQHVGASCCAPKLPVDN